MLHELKTFNIFITLILYTIGIFSNNSLFFCCVDHEFQEKFEIPDIYSDTC